MNKIKIIISKEWAEVFKNRIVLFTVAFLPIIFMALPIVTLIGMNSFEGDMSSMNSSEMKDLVGQLCNGLDEMSCTYVYMLNLYTLMFMMLPVIIPVTIAAYSIVGEKTSRSLEPLLATPITTTELLLGKMIAACVPAIAVTWAAFLVYAIFIWFMVSDVVFGLVMAPMWLAAIFVVGPLLSLLAVSSAVLVSSRVSDPRAAEQLAAFVIMPLIVLLIGQSVGLIIIDARMIFFLGVLVFVLDIVFVALTVKLFQRETILTQWK